MVLCRRNDLLNKAPEYLYKNCRLCTDHFQDCMFSNNLKNRLNHEAKPTLFNIPNPPAQVGQKRRLIKKSQFHMAKVSNKMFFFHTYIFSLPKHFFIFVLISFYYFFYHLIQKKNKKMEGTNNGMWINYLIIYFSFLELSKLLLD